MEKQSVYIKISTAEAGPDEPASVCLKDPEAYNLEGGFFTNYIHLLFKEEIPLTYEILVKKVRNFDGTAADQLVFRYHNIENGYRLNIADYPEGEYEMLITSHHEEENKISNTKTYHFAIARQEKVIQAVGLKDCLAFLEADGIYKYTDKIIDDYIEHIVVPEEEKTTKGVFVIIQSPDEPLYHKGFVGITNYDQMHEVIFTTDDYGEEITGLKQGIAFIPIEEDVCPEEVCYIIESYEDKERTVLKKSNAKMILLTDENCIFIDSQAEFTTIRMSEPKENVHFQNVNIYFDNFCNGTYQAAYQITKNGKKMDLKYVTSDITHIMLNAEGIYEIEAYVMTADTNHILLSEKKTYSINKKETAKLKVLNERVYSGTDLTAKLIVNPENPVKSIKCYIKKYSEKIDIAPNESNEYDITINISNDYPKGQHVLIAQIEYLNGTQELVSDSFIAFKNDTQMNKTREEIIRNTAFVFSGHNIKDVVVLAIESLIKKSGIRRDQIFFFDDLSTDGTIEELSKRDITILSWDEKRYNEFVNSEVNNDLCIRVDCICSCIFEAGIPFKYIMLLDGDTIYYGDAVRCIVDRILDRAGGEIPHFFGMAKSKEYNGENYPDLGKQIWQNYLWIDQGALVDTNILNFQLDEALKQKKKYGGKIFDSLYDTGSQMYYKVLASEKKYIFTFFQEKNEDLSWYNILTEKVFHLGWVSSLMRNDTMFQGSVEEELKSIESILDKNAVGELCDELGMSLNKIKMSIYQKALKSPVV